MQESGWLYNDKETNESARVESWKLKAKINAREKKKKVQMELQGSKLYFAGKCVLCICGVYSDCQWFYIIYLWLSVHVSFLSPYLIFIAICSLCFFSVIVLMCVFVSINAVGLNDLLERASQLSDKLHSLSTSLTNDLVSTECSV